MVISVLLDSCNIACSLYILEEIVEPDGEALKTPTTSIPFVFL